MSKNKNHEPDFMKELTDSFLTGNTKDVVDIITFMEAPWGLKFKPRPVQKFILRAYYGMEMDNKNRYISVSDQVNEKVLYQFTEKEFLQYLYDNGKCNTKEVEGKNFRELDLVLGRRAGKSVLTSAISAYELYKLVKKGNPLEYYGVPEHDTICIVNVAPTDDQAGIIFTQTLKLASLCPFIKTRVQSPTQESFDVLTDLDSLKTHKKNNASISVISGGCASNALRGRNALVVAMDEMAFFLDNGGRFSGDEVYKALTPSTTTFKGEGKIICISSPYAKYGKFYERYQQSFDEKDTTLMFQMYTAMVNPEITSADLKTARSRGKTSFAAEFGAEFTDTISAWVDDSNQFKDCLGKPIDRFERRGEVGITYFMGLDLGLKNDGTAIAISHKDLKTNKIIVDFAEVFYSQSSDVWENIESIYKGCTKFADKEIIQIDDVCAEIQDLVKWFPTKSGFFDQYNGYALMEKLHNMGLKQFRMESLTETLNSEMYQLLKTLYCDKLVELPNHPMVVAELLSLQAEKAGKNKIKVRAPNKNGAHDDLSDAIAVSVYECFKHFHGSPANITTSFSQSGRIVKGAADAVESNATMFQMSKIQKHGLPARGIDSKKRSMGRFHR